ncbi:MAG: glycosyltransferase [Thermomonas sp.]|uniref:glycosyltransferase n=1 Tax=Thermomonas sp. TaxID=1971895 RepID=UPI0039E6D840
MTAAITIHFHKPELTARCIDSLLADGWTTILVWDNSEDDGVSLLLLEEQYRNQGKVQFARSPANLGFGRGMNAALAELGNRGYAGPVLLVNNDARVMPGMRAALEAQLAETGSTALIAPRLLQDGCEQGWLYYQPWLALVSKRRLPGSFAYLSGCCLLVQRPDNTQPLFDEDFFMYGEDVELSWRMRRQGACLLLLDRSYVQHEGSASSGQASEAYERFLVQSHWLLAKKLAPNPGARILMQVLRVPSLLARAYLRSWRYRSLVPLRVIFSRKMRN